MKTGRSLKEVLSELAWEEEHKKSYDRATALEGIRWQAATMPEGQWRELNDV